MSKLTFEQVDRAWYALNQLHEKMDKGKITAEDIQEAFEIYTEDFINALDNIAEFADMIVTSF